MENQVQLFESEEFGRIRVVEIDGQPWFILKDICYVLNLSNPTMIAERLDDDEKEILKPKPGLVLDIPNRGLIIVNESGLYAVIIRSDKPEAKKFRRWITNEILPSIRQHGAYITDAVLDEMTRSREFADNLLHRLQSERHKTAAMREYIDELVPKARYCDVILRCQKRHSGQHYRQRLRHVGRRFQQAPARLKNPVPRRRHMGSISEIRR